MTNATQYFNKAFPKKAKAETKARKLLSVIDHHHDSLSCRLENNWSDRLWDRIWELYSLRERLIIFLKSVDSEREYFYRHTLRLY